MLKTKITKTRKIITGSVLRRKVMSISMPIDIKKIAIKNILKGIILLRTLLGMCIFAKNIPAINAPSPSERPNVAVKYAKPKHREIPVKRPISALDIDSVI